VSPSVDIISITNGWQAAVAIALIVALLIWPGVNSHLTRKHLSHEMKPNSGSSMRDAVDKANKALIEVVDTQVHMSAVQETQGGLIKKISEEQMEQGDRIAVLEQAVEKRGGFLFRHR